MSMSNDHLDDPTVQDDAQEREEQEAESKAAPAADIATAEPDADDELGEDSDADAALDPLHLRLLEAVLFASAETLTEKQLAARLPDDADLKGLLRALKRTYADRGVNLVRAGKAWGFRTAPDLARQMNMTVEVSRKPSRAAVETLAIVAYHQPVTRAEIEEIRGVGLSKGTLDHLFEQGWIRPGPRRETPGRPVTWFTTDSFLDHFALDSLKDLPGIDELKAAGLLDSSPALNAYRTRAGNMGPDAELVDTEPSAEEDAAEPLDPEGGEDDLPRPTLRAAPSDAAE